MNETTARRLVKDRAGLLCERCGYVAGAEFHHRKNRSQGGGWSAANALWLCGPCHRYVTEHPDDAVTYGWACRAWMHPATEPVLLARHGWTYLDELGHYLRMFKEAL